MTINRAPYKKYKCKNSKISLDWKFGGLDSNVIVQNEYLDVQILRYLIKDLNGEKLYDTIAIKEPKTNCVLVLLDSENKIGLVKEWRPIPSRWFWACIRGFGELNDKSSLSVARRELIEEIGEYKIQEIRKIGTLFQNTTYFENSIDIILLRIENKQNKNTFENGIVDLKFFENNEIREMICSERIKDQLSLSSLAKYLMILDLSK